VQNEYPQTHGKAINPIRFLQNAQRSVSLAAGVNEGGDSTETPIAAPAGFEDGVEGEDAVARAAEGGERDE